MNHKRKFYTANSKHSNYLVTLTCNSKECYLARYFEDNEKDT